jgi:hypothetical protein
MTKQRFIAMLHFEARAAAEFSGNFLKTAAIIERRGDFGA